MRIACKLLLPLFATIAAAALSGRPAAAQIEALHEGTGNHCGVLDTTNPHEPTGECEVVMHDVQSPHLPFPGVILSNGGMILSACHVESEAYVAEDGTGLITHQTLTDVPGLGDSCQVAPCVEATGQSIPWPLQTSETAAGDMPMTSTFCLGRSVVCTVERDVDQAAGHHYVFRAEDSPCLEGTGVELTGRAESETSNLEVVH